MFLSHHNHHKLDQSVVPKMDKQLFIFARQKELPLLQMAYNLIVLNWLIGRNGWFKWRSSSCNTIIRLNWNIT